MRVYIAGALFNQAETEFNKKIEQLLIERGFSVFLPQEGAEDLFGTEGWQDKVFELNYTELGNADIVLAIIEGMPVDDGTSWEIGCAWMSYIPVVALRTDFRTVGPEGRVNLMIERSVARFCSTVEEAVDALVEIRDNRDGIVLRGRANPKVSIQKCELG